MKIAVLGSNGQLGTDLMKTLREKHELVGLTHLDVEVSDYDSCLRLKDHHPDVVINTAALHRVDQCEIEPLKAFSVNALGARNVATVSNEIGATDVFISTDYVFDGSMNRPYTENYVPCPVSTYGISKLAGEIFTRQSSKHYIVRVASLFGVAGSSGKGGNFVETMIAKAKNNEPISVVDDMWMSPTYTKDAAATIEKIIDAKLPYGVYHVTNKGYCTWFDFANEILKLVGSRPTVTPIKTSQPPGKARRPRFSALKSARLPRYHVRMREWKEALVDYLTEKGHMSKK
jgi:dTDP-4-dehydrorhamnose reductase